MVLANRVDVGGRRGGSVTLKQDGPGVGRFLTGAGERKTKETV